MFHFLTNFSPLPNDINYKTIVLKLLFLKSLLKTYNYYSKLFFSYVYSQRNALTNEYSIEISLILSQHTVIPSLTQTLFND